MLDLQTVNFTIFPDFVVFSDTIALPPDSPIGIFNTGIVDTLSGSDLIRSTLEGTITERDLIPIALQNSGEISMGLGRDRIEAHASFQDLSGFGDGVIGIDISGGLIDTGFWADHVEGSAEVIATNRFDEAEAYGIYSSARVGVGTILTGSGGDTVIGEAYAASETIPFAVGILSTSVDTGGGADQVIGKATAVGGEDDEPASAVGIGDFFRAGTVIDTGRGDDLVKGFATAILSPAGEDAVEGEVEGIRDVEVTTGAGDDRVIGKGLLLAEDGGDYGSSNGLLSMEVVTGDGRDTVIGEVIAHAGDLDGVNDGSFNRGISSLLIDTGDDDDKVIGKISLHSEGESRIGSNKGIEISEITTGEGHDLVVGRVTIETGDESDASRVAGIEETNILTQDGNDRVIGKVSIEAGLGSELGDANGIFDSNIDTGAGHDLVKGFVSLTPSGAPSEAFGAGLQGGEETTIDTAAGNDKVVGIGADIAIDGDSFGIADYTIRLSDGWDHVYARGASAGVNDVLIEGGRGWDTFDLHSGTGFVDGGDHLDTLRLSGDSGDFKFTETGFQEGTIDDSHLGGPTNLQVADIELFRFDDGLFLFDQLF